MKKLTILIMFVLMALSSSAELWSLCHNGKSYTVTSYYTGAGHFEVTGVFDDRMRCKCDRSYRWWYRIEFFGEFCYNYVGKAFNPNLPHYDATDQDYEKLNNLSVSDAPSTDIVPAFDVEVDHFNILEGVSFDPFRLNLDFSLKFADSDQLTIYGLKIVNPINEGNVDMDILTTSDEDIRIEIFWPESNIRYSEQVSVKRGLNNIHNQIEATPGFAIVRLFQSGQMVTRKVYFN